MNRRAIIIWGIVGLIAIMGIILTYILLRNNGSSDTKNTGNQDNITNGNTDDNTVLPNESEITNIELLDEGSGDYYSWYTMPTKLQSQFKNLRESGHLDYFYSQDLGIAFSYEAMAIGTDKYIQISPEDNTIYVYIFETPKDSGQSIEIINIDSDKRFNSIPDIITTQLLTPVQNTNCEVIEKDAKYSIIAKDSNVKDSTAICGQYAKGNNRFFIKPQEEGTATNKLVFVSAGDKELSYDGSGNGKFWYESVVVE
jgi:hypothetical protein